MGRAALVSALFLLLAAPLWGAPIVPFSEEYRTIRTEHFKIHFPASKESIARRVARLAEDLHRRLEPRFKSGAADTHLVLVFDSDLVNAFATSYGMDRILLYMTGPEPDDFARYEDWIQQLIEHEYVHILTLRPYRGPTNFLFRLILGLPPNLLTPDGLAEGYPVYEESRPLKAGEGHGRLHDPLILSKRDTLYLFHRTPSLEEMMTGTERWPYGAVPYLFGGRFVSFLREACGEEAMDRYFLSYIPAIFPDWRFRSLKCGGLEQSYDLFVEQEGAAARRRLAFFSAEGVSARQRLTFDGGSKRYLRAGPESPVYFARPDARSAGLYSLDGRQSSLIYRANSISGFYLDGSTPVSAELRTYLPGSIYKNELHRNGKLLFDDDVRREAPAANRSGVIVYIRRVDPFVELVQLVPDRSPRPSSFWRHKAPGTEKVVLRLPMSYGMFQPAVSKDGEVAVVIRRPESLVHSLVVCKDDACEERLSVKASIANPSFQEDASGQHLLFASDVGGVYDIFSYAPSGVKRLTHSLTGFPAALMTNRGLYVVGQAENGDEIFLVTELFHEDAAGFDVRTVPFQAHQPEEVIEEQGLGHDRSDVSAGLEPRGLTGENVDSQPYSAFFSFRPFMNGMLSGPISYVDVGLAGYDALSRHEVSAGVGQYDQDRSYTFATYSYRRLFPDIVLSYTGMPLDRDVPEYCGHFRNKDVTDYCRGERRFSFQESQIAFDMLFQFRLLTNRVNLFAGRSLLRNTQLLSTSLYAYPNMDLGTVGASYQAYYFESYSRSISPERGFFLELEGVHHPAGWSRGYPSVDGSEPVTVSYERFAGRFEIYFPFLVDYHVPVLSGSISYLNGRDFALQADRLSTELPGLNPQDSAYGRAVQIWRFDYRFPVWQRRSRLFPSIGWFSFPSLGVRSISLSPFVATGQAYEDIVYPDRWVNTAGVTLDMQLYAFYQPFSVQATYARGDGEAGEGQFSLGFSVGARPASSYGRSLRHARRPEYLRPTYSNR